jgi:hypothetical protein
MTWSIIAREPETGVMGLAVASRFFAAGALVPHSAPDAGLVATQALVNPTYGPLGLELLRARRSPDETVAALIEPDEGWQSRQVHVMGLDGRTAAFTGSACVDWAGSRSERDLSVAGNMLAGRRDDRRAARLTGRKFARAAAGFHRPFTDAGADCATHHQRYGHERNQHGDPEYPVGHHGPRGGPQSHS